MNRGRAVVPETVRRALQLSKRDKIHYRIRPNGEVVLTRAEPPDGDDPLLAAFLGFREGDLANHPERLQAVDVGLVERLQGLVGDVMSAIRSRSMRWSGLGFRRGYHWSISPPPRWCF